MRVVKTLTITTLVALDLGQGAVMMFWPALWHEWAHRTLTAPALFTWQYLGALLLARGLYLAARARRRRPVPMALWWLEVPADVLLGWRLWPVSTWSSGVYLVKGLLIVVAVWILGSLAGIQDPQPLDQESSP